MPSPLTERRSLSELIMTLRTAGLVDPADPLDDAELLVGWESAVVRTADGWIHRLAREGQETYERELAVLALVDGRLGVPTPRVEQISRTELVMSYRTITGHSLDLRAVREQTTAERSALTRSWAAALARMHGLTAQVTGQIEVPVVDHTGMRAAVEPAFEQARGPVRDALAELKADWDDHHSAASGTGRVLLHGDFHPGNMVFGSSTGPLTGLWDFTCVELGDPAEDWAHLIRDGAELAAETARHYTALTGRSVDLELARLIGRLEDVSDAVIEGRPIDEAMIGGRWRTPRRGPGRGWPGCRRRSPAGSGCWSQASSRSARSRCAARCPVRRG